MFNRTKIYTVYVCPEAEEPLETMVLIPDSFSIWAFLFHALWALYHQLWRVFFTLFFVIGSVSALGMQGVISPEAAEVLRLGIAIWLGFEASDLWGAALERKGYVVYDIVAASDESQGRQRFLDRQSTFSPSLARQSAG